MLRGHVRSYDVCRFSPVVPIHFIDWVLLQIAFLPLLLCAIVNKQNAFLALGRLFILLPLRRSSRFGFPSRSKRAVHGFTSASASAPAPSSPSTGTCGSWWCSIARLVASFIAVFSLRCLLGVALHTIVVTSPGTSSAIGLRELIVAVILLCTRVFPVTVSTSALIGILYRLVASAGWTGVDGV